MRPDAFLAVSDPTRRRILELLARDELSVSALCAEFDLTQPAVSKHLRILREAGLVSVRSEGRFRRYAIEPRALEPVRDWLAHFESFWVDRLDRLGAHLRAKRRPGRGKR
jgi:DNA-binding transcriptional ArsR family regulator